MCKHTRPIKLLLILILKKQNHPYLGWSEGECIFRKGLFLGELFLWCKCKRPRETEPPVGWINLSHFQFSPFSLGEKPFPEPFRSDLHYACAEFFFMLYAYQKCKRGSLRNLTGISVGESGHPVKTTSQLHSLWYGKVFPMIPVWWRS